ncbi:MAG: laccase domain-containing protein [Coriobacteriia bacterium]|nr:laccase domain-containing protein [Coriobacteriia bacterium]
MMSHFSTLFATVSRDASGGLELVAVSHASLTDAGVPSCSIASLGGRTVEETERCFSYRAEGGRTGRHGALVCIHPRPSWCCSS